MGSNLQYKGIQEYLKSIDSLTTEEEGGPSVEEVNKDWKKLALFMAGRK